MIVVANLNFLVLWILIPIIALGALFGAAYGSLLAIATHRNYRRSSAGIRAMLRDFIRWIRNTPSRIRDAKDEKEEERRLAEEEKRLQEEEAEKNRPKKVFHVEDT